MARYNPETLAKMKLWCELLKAATPAGKRVCEILSEEQLLEMAFDAGLGPEDFDDSDGECW